MKLPLLLALAAFALASPASAAEHGPGAAPDGAPLATASITEAAGSGTGTAPDIRSLIPVPDTSPSALLVEEHADANHDATASITELAGSDTGTAPDIRSLIPVPDTSASVLLVEEHADASHDATASIGAPPEAPAAGSQPPPPAPPTISVPLPDYVPATPIISTLPPEALQTQAIRPEDLASALEALGPKSGLPTREMAAITDYYQAQGGKPLWFGGADWSEGARQVVARLGHAAEDGLRPADYPAALPAKGDSAAFATADVSLSIAAVRYARDARGARVDPLRISAAIGARRTLPDTAEVLAALTAAADADTTLQAYNPPQPGYRALRDQLAALQEDAAPPPAVIIPPGRLLRAGMEDKRVPLLRQRLGLAPADNETYDAALSDTVAAFQKAHGLQADGVLGRATTAALSGRAPSAAPRAAIIANMERWRWLPRDLGERYVMVNIPEFTMRLVENGAVVHSARVVVGKPQTQTPVFSGMMKYLVVNPYWNVPPSILKKDFLPHMAADPGYTERQGYEVVRTRNGFRVRQPPGERNALGRIKFMFPNDYAVYLHDTPSRALFSRATRAYSHGCVRVQNPFELASLVMGWSEKRLKSLLGAKERYLNLEQPLPVHLVYFTSFVDESGRLETLPDLYGHNRKVEAALGLS